MSRFVWLSSYPKSGNSWVRFLIFNLLFGEVENTADLERLVPDCHKLSTDNLYQAMQNNPALVIKTHWKLEHLQTVFPYLKETSCFVYIVRNPIDVLVSNWNYLLLTMYSHFSGFSEEELECKFIEYVDIYIENRGDPRWIKQGMGSWEENVKSWLENRLDLRSKVIRYEDLLFNPFSIIKELCDFLGIDTTSNEIEQAIRNSSFEKMKELEEQEITGKSSNGLFFHPQYESAHQDGLRFVSREKTRKWKGKLSEEQITKATTAFSSLMNELGYN